RCAPLTARVWLWSQIWRFDDHNHTLAGDAAPSWGVGHGHGPAAAQPKTPRAPSPRSVPSCQEPSSTTAVPARAITLTNRSAGVRFEGAAIVRRRAPSPRVSRAIDIRSPRRNDVTR